MKLRSQLLGRLRIKPRVFVGELPIQEKTACEHVHWGIKPST